MNVRPVDKSKKSNIKCEHCKHWNRENLTSTAISSGSVKYYFQLPTCEVTKKPKHYYNRCKAFEWKD